MHADMLHARGWSAYPSVRDRDVNAAIDEDMAGSSLVLQVEWLVSAFRLWGPRGRQWRKAVTPGRKAAVETGLCEARSRIFPVRREWASLRER